MADLPVDHGYRNAASVRALEELEYALLKCRTSSPCESSGPRPPKGPGYASRRRLGVPLSQGQNLLSTIESDIIPRLLIAHSGGHVSAESASPAPPSEPVRPEPEDLLEFTRIILDHEAPFAIAFIDGLRHRGISIDSIFLDLLAPAARRLGEMWETDETDFVAVTIALGRLQQTLHDLRRAFLDDRVDIAFNPRRRAILTTYSEDQHIFGALIVAEFLRRARWCVSFEPCLSIEQTREAVASEWYALAGLSIATERDADCLREAIANIRDVSHNRDIAVLIGGRAVNENPALVDYVRADATAENAELAAIAAENLFAHIC